MCNTFKMKITFPVPRSVSWVFVCASIVACQKQISSDTSPVQDPTSYISFKAYLTDHQTPVFDSIFIDIRQLEIRTGDDAAANQGWVSLPIHPGVYNILRFRNGLDTLFGSINLPNAPIRKIRLTLGTQNSAMKDRQSFPLPLKDSHGQITINIDGNNFDLAGNQAQLWLDFDAGNSIRVNNSGQGNSNGFELDPHINVFGQHNTGRIEGKVLPIAARPIVKAVMGSDTATAIPDGNGEFKICGLRAGSYQVIFEGQNNYRDTTITQVNVMSKEDTKLPTLMLHL
jgi:hypothetical protein